MAKRINIYKGPLGLVWEGPPDFIPLGECWVWRNGQWECYDGPDWLWELLEEAHAHHG